MFKQTNKQTKSGQTLLALNYKQQSDFLFLCLFSLKLVCFKTNPNAGLFAVVKIPFASVCCTAQNKGNRVRNGKGRHPGCTNTPKRGRKASPSDKLPDRGPVSPCQLYPIRCPVVSSSLAICKCNAIPKKY